MTEEGQTLYLDPIPQLLNPAYHFKQVQLNPQLKAKGVPKLILLSMVLDRKNWNFVNERLFLLGIEGEPSQKVNRVSEEKAKPQSKTLSVGI